MHRIWKLDNPQIAEPLFTGWQETLIYSCLHGVMGEIYAAAADDPGTACPRSAMAMLGDFCFLAGEPDAKLVSYKPESCVRDFMIMVPQDSTQKESWAEIIRQVYGERVHQVTRYAIKKEENIWDMEALRKAVRELPDGYVLREIDEEIYHRCKEAEWSRDLVALYRDYEQYRDWGGGVVILHGQEIVSGASSYSGYRGGIEIEIDTREDHRRKGLAYICGAGLILKCVSRGLYPSWDAQNLWSVALAEKLGYHFDHAYTAYEIWGY